MIKTKKILRNISAVGGTGSSSGHVVLSLSLFIMLLAFFIVLNSVSDYSEPKVSKAFDSLDTAFATNFIENDLKKQNTDEREENQSGSGDSIEDMQGILRSILPGLDMDMSKSPNGGSIMAVRMKKYKFEKLSNRLIPLFLRILSVKDDVGNFDLSITSYVRDPIGKSAKYSYDIASNYRNEIIKKGLNSNRISLMIEKGNPAFLQFRFYAGGGI